MMIISVLLACLAALGGASTYDAYYGDGFIRLQEVIRPGNVFLYSIFKNLHLLNSTGEMCAAHLSLYESSLRKKHEPWAKYYLDAIGGTGPGLLSGSTVSLGDYDGCVSQRTPHFGSNYCWIKVEVEGESPHRTSWVPNNAPIIFSICVPDSCDGQQLELLTRDLATKHNFTVSVSCQSTRPSLSVLDIIALTFFSFIGLITISTAIPEEWIPTRHQGILKIWASFSIKRNLRTLLQSKKNSDMLSSLHALRFISQCTIIWYHMVLLSLIGYYPVQNKFYFNEFFRSWIGTIEIELVLSVDTFFLIGGILLTYNCFKRKSDLHLLKYYTHRYLRLTPPLAACLLIYASFGNKFCTGPLCYVTVDKDRQTCQTYWWTNLLYINNFYPGLLHSCMPHTWFLSADWQLFVLLSPLIVIVINKWPEHIYKLVAAIFLFSISSAFVVAFFYRLSSDSFVFSSNSEAEDYYNKMYAIPNTRAGPWSMGLLLGILLHRHKKNPIVLPKWAVAVCWAGSVVVLCGSVEMNLPILKEYVSTGSFLNALVIAIQRNAFALAVSWIIYASTTNIAGPVGTFLSWRGFEPLGKISYSTYLIHKLIVDFYIGETRAPVYFSTANQLPPIMGIIVISFFAGFLLYMTFEAPSFQLEKLLFQRGKSSNGGTSAQPTGVVSRDDHHILSTISPTQVQLKER